MENRAEEVATLAAGCFWCIEAVFEELRGVNRVQSGYSGGTVPNPTYEQVCTGTTGHAEVLQVHFDPGSISFSDLLDVFFSTPAAPTIFLAEDTVLYSLARQVWVTEGAIRLKWDAVPDVSGYHLYRDTAPITAVNPGTLIADESQLGGSALGAGFNNHAFIDGDSQTNLGATAIPTSGGPNLPAGTYYYKVFSLDGIGTPSLDGPEVAADHAARGFTPEDILMGVPGRLPPDTEQLTVLIPTFSWSAATIPEIWAFTIGEPVIGVDPVWIHLVWPSGQSDVTLPYAAVGGFSAKDASALQPGTLYTWTVIGYDSNGWGVVQGRPYSISTP